MPSIAEILGLRATSAPIPSLTGYYAIWHFVYAYAILSSRFFKMGIPGLDHQASPRQDLAKYGDAAVKAGKLTQAQLDQLYRMENCHANSVEHFPLFLGSMLFAHVAGVPTAVINASGLAYTVARLAYGAAYTYIADDKTANLRGLAWWASNIVCLRLFWLGAKTLNQ